MKPKNTRPFELKMGKVGVVITVSGLAILLFLGFILGVYVGINMETAPREIAWGIPFRLVNALGITHSSPRVAVPTIIPAPAMPKEPEQAANEPAAAESSTTPAPTTPASASPVPVTTPTPTPLRMPAPTTPAPPLTAPAPAPATSHETPAAAKPTESTEKEASPARTDRGDFIIQVGSFREPKKAQEVAAKIEKLGYKAHTYKVKVREKGTWHQVIVGRFPTQARAEAAARKIGTHIAGLDCIIRRISKD